MTKKIVRRKLITAPQNAEDAAIFATERFRVTLQHSVNTLMLEQGLSRQDLASRMGVTPARVSQFFSDNCNVTIRTLANLLHALGADYSFEAAGSHLVLKPEPLLTPGTEGPPSLSQSAENIQPPSYAYVSPPTKTAFTNIVWHSSQVAFPSSPARTNGRHQESSVSFEDALPFAEAA